MRKYIAEPSSVLGSTSVAASSGSSADMLEAFYTKLDSFREHPIENADNIESSVSIQADRRDNYFGEQAAFQWGDKIADAYLGKTISKRKSKAEAPGGLVYEAKQLGIGTYDLLEALEGMCADGRAVEHDSPEDSYYEIKSKKRHPVQGLFYNEEDDPESIWKNVEGAFSFDGDDEDDDYEDDDDDFDSDDDDLTPEGFYKFFKSDADEAVKKKAAKILYEWYMNEDAESLPYDVSDILDMCDAADDGEERDIVLKALGREDLYSACAINCSSYAKVNYGQSVDDLYIQLDDNDGRYHWKDSYGTSDEGFDTPEEAYEAFLNFMEVERPDTVITRNISGMNNGWMVNHPGYDPIGSPSPSDEFLESEPLAPQYAEYAKQQEAALRENDKAPEDSVYDAECGMFANPDDPDLFWSKDTMSYSIRWNPDTYDFEHFDIGGGR